MSSEGRAAQSHKWKGAGHEGEGTIPNRAESLRKLLKKRSFRPPASQLLSDSWYQLSKRRYPRANALKSAASGGSRNMAMITAEPTTPPMNAKTARGLLSWWSSRNS